MRKVLIGCLLLLVVAAPSKTAKDEKKLSVYGCTPLVESGNTNYLKVCKIYEPETGKRFIVGIVDDSRGGGIAIVQIDK